MNNKFGEDPRCSSSHPGANYWLPTVLTWKSFGELSYIHMYMKMGVHHVCWTHILYKYDCMCIYLYIISSIWNINTMLMFIYIHMCVSCIYVYVCNKIYMISKYDVYVYIFMCNFVYQLIICFVFNNKDTCVDKNPKTLDLGVDPGVTQPCFDGHSCTQMVGEASVCVSAHSTLQVWRNETKQVGQS